MMFSIKALFTPSEQPPVIDNEAVEEETKIIRNKMDKFHSAAEDFEKTVKEFLDKRERYHRKKIGH